MLRSQLQSATEEAAATRQRALNAAEQVAQLTAQRQALERRFAQTESSSDREEGAVKGGDGVKERAALSKVRVWVVCLCGGASSSQ